MTLLRLFSCWASRPAPRLRHGPWRRVKQQIRLFLTAPPACVSRLRARLGRRVRRRRSAQTRPTGVRARLRPQRGAAVVPAGQRARRRRPADHRSAPRADAEPELTRRAAATGSAAAQYAEYTSSSLMTRGLHSWQYGRFEMRARIDTRAGLWPAFWTLGVSGAWPQTARSTSWSSTAARCSPTSRGAARRATGDLGRLTQADRVLRRPLVGRRSTSGAWTGTSGDRRCRSTDSC